MIRPDRSNKVSHLLLVIGLASVLFLPGLTAVGLTDRDEGRNAEAGREMFESGDWITPTFNYEPRFIKPAMLYWLMSPSYWAFGVNEFAARFPSALFGIALIALQYLFLARTRGATVALFGTVMLLLSPEVVGLARLALTDMVLMFFTTLSVYAFWLGFHGTSSARLWLMVSYGAMACGTLVKGPVGMLVPALAIIPYIAVTRQWRRLWHRGFVLGGSATFLVLTLPWYAVMLMLHGAGYSAQAQEHTLNRFLNPFYGWGGTPLFYVPVLLVGVFPWSGFLAVALYERYKEARQGGALTRAADDLELFAALWVAAIFVFFSLAATRLPHYIGPIYPAAAIVTACYWTRARTAPASRGCRLGFQILLTVGGALALLFAALPAAFTAFSDKLIKSFPYAAHFQFGAGPYLSAAVLAVGMAVVAYSVFYKTRADRGFWSAGATVAVLVLITLHATLPQLSRYLIAPPQELAAKAGSLLKPGDRLIVYGTNRPSMVFYAQRKVEMIHRNEEANIRPYLQQPGRTMIVLPATLRDRLPEETAGFPIVQERFGWILVGQDMPAGGMPTRFSSDRRHDYRAFMD
jgi:4-amino-4-deoxy-L-arabinose transferase-like glycosyltransferase